MRATITLWAALGLIPTAAFADRDEGCTAVARFDERNNRLFVVCPTITEMSDPAIARVITTLLAQRDAPADGYSISFFSRSDMAGYKTESHLAEYLASGEWRDAYLGEYDVDSGELTLWPLMPDKRVVRELSTSAIGGR